MFLFCSLIPSALPSARKTGNRLDEEYSGGTTISIWVAAIALGESSISHVTTANFRRPSCFPLVDAALFGRLVQNITYILAKSYTNQDHSIICWRCTFSQERVDISAVNIEVYTDEINEKGIFFSRSYSCASDGGHYLNAVVLFTTKIPKMKHVYLMGLPRRHNIESRWVCHLWEYFRVCYILQMTILGYRYSHRFGYTV